MKASFCTAIWAHSTSRIFEDYLSFKGIIHSFSRKGNPYDNACIESFHSMLKKEEINHHKYNDFNTARKAVFEYIETWYNRKRIHDTINYLTRRLLMKQHKRHQKLNFLCLHY
nr:integrase core domain-containing protein [uncultured Anaerocolumna sp.]